MVARVSGVMPCPGIVRALFGQFKDAAPRI
jgi:hypothetical protein